jgi:hypothetical protein
MTFVATLILRLYVVLHRVPPELVYDFPLVEEVFLQIGFYLHLPNILVDVLSVGL